MSASKDKRKELWRAAKLARLHPEEVPLAVEAVQPALDAEKAKYKEATHKDRCARAQEGAAERGVALRNQNKQNAALQEQARRVLAKRHLLPFTMRFNPSYLPGWVHKDICTRLEKFSQDVVEKKNPRLMLFCPPRHGKSELASKSFPAWHLGHHPEHEIIACSYAGSLAMAFSRKVRTLIRDAAYRGVFPKMKLDPENQSAENWMTTMGGGYVAAGVGGGITGKGAHILIIDDPVKNAEDADSDTARQSVKDWYNSTAYTRLAPGGGVLIIQTRWHDDDLSGWLLAQMKADEGDTWEVVDYPAMALEDEKYRKKGEALHPARYDETALARIRRAVGERTWWALYQQRPVAEEGAYFTKSMFRYYDGAPPQLLRIYAAWDLAVTKKERSDYTVGVVIGVDINEDIYVLHMERGKWDGSEIVEKILDTYRDWRPEITGMEAGQIQSSIEPFLEKRIAERGKENKLYHEFYYNKLPTRNKDKEARARPIQARMQQGKVYFPAKAEMTTLMRDEMLRFPNTTHDDMVDALAWVGRMIIDLQGAAGPKAVKRKSWRDKLKRLKGRTSDNAAAMAA